MTDTFEMSLHGQPVGTLQVRDTAAGPRWFTWWEPAWLLAPQRPTVSLSLRDRRLSGQQAWGSKPPYFVSNLLPEPDSALRRRLARTHDLDEADDAALLSLLGEDMSGALSVRPADARMPPRKVRAGAPERPLENYRASLGGMQLKFSVNRGERISLPAVGETGHWILKIPMADQPRLPRLEAATLAWASAVGFEVPEAVVEPTSRVDGLPDDVLAQVEECLLVRRFDRPTAGARVHMEELCSVMGFHPQEKYPADRVGEARATSHTLTGVGTIVRQFAGEADAALFARRVLFDALVGNGDAHLKNWAFLFPDGRQPRLAPVYDVVPTRLLNDLDTSLALPLTGHALPGGAAFTYITPDNMRRFAKKLNLDPDEIVRDCKALVERAVDTFTASIRPFDVPVPMTTTWHANLMEIASPWTG